MPVSFGQSGGSGGGGGGGGTWGSIVGTQADQTDLQSALDAKAPKASPTLTGTVTLPLTTAGFVKTTSGGVISSTAAVALGGTDVSGSLPATKVSSGANQDGVAPVADGSGGLYYGSILVRVGADQNTFLAATGGNAEVCLANGIRISYVGPWYYVSTGDFGGGFRMLQVLNGGANGLNDVYFNGAQYNTYYSLQGPGTQFTAAPSQIAAGGDKIVWEQTIDRCDAIINLTLKVSGGDANNGYFSFLVEFCAAGNGTTTFAEVLGSGNGYPVFPNVVSAGMTGTTLVMSISGAKLTVTLHNGSSVAARQTTTVVQFNCHYNAS